MTETYVCLKDAQLQNKIEVSNRFSENKLGARLLKVFHTLLTPCIVCCYKL